MEKGRKFVASEWLKSAETDLTAIDAMIDNPSITNIVAFHCQQCVEKSLKALLELFGYEVPKTHSTAKLYGLIREKVILALPLEILDKLDDLYIEARYPGELGFMPYGKPGIKDTEEFYRVAREVYRIAKKIIEEST